MTHPRFVDQSHLPALERVAQEGLKNAALGFSGLLGQTLSVKQPRVQLVPLLDIPKFVGGPETEVTGVYLRYEGEISGQMMLIIPVERALQLVDLLMGEAPGTTQQLGRLERSALQEVGNQAGTFFLNAVAQLIDAPIRPTPPAVMVDMVGAMMDIIVATSGGISDNVLLMQAEMVTCDQSLETAFWVIPDNHALDVIAAGVKA